ncbi:hypothetical protein EVAR_30013_1 [Eumeta japonica]|uniref:Uncharacterized protein n=1 Tax=Eumeta variegata TaxID=151549 RepID=A0A4C1VV14_EUMVA|nr:hypothetical protein EVAR_30013_1 [Eumeta japonica]
MRRSSAPRHFLLHIPLPLRVPILRHCDAFTTYFTAAEFPLLRGQRECEAPKSRRSPTPMDIHYPKGITSALPAFLLRRRYVLEGRWTDGGEWDDGAESGPPETSLTR